jgi:dienelactone hydrolase
MKRLINAFFIAGALALACSSVTAAQAPARLANTELLTLEGDIASHLVTGIDRFLLGELEKSVARRKRHWRYDFSSPEAYSVSVEPNREHLAHIIGVRDERIAFDAPELVSTTERPALVGKGQGYDVYAVRWPAFGDVTGEGLLLVPTGGVQVADVVAIGDADQPPEMLAGLVKGVPVYSQFARRLAESGCRVLVPTLISRQRIQRMAADGQRGVTLTNREFLYRPAFEMGRHPIGYEVQKVLAAVDWFAKQNTKVGVMGWGEGGLIALYAAALDTRIDAVCVSGYFSSRQNVWTEPIDRNVFGLLDEFGDAELASMLWPRPLIIEAARGPESVIPAGTSAAPGRLATPKLGDVRSEVHRLKQLISRSTFATDIRLIISGEGEGPYGSDEALNALLQSLAKANAVPLGQAPQPLVASFPLESRQERQIHEIDRHTQWLLGESAQGRKQFFSKLDTSSTQNYEKTIEWYRQYYYTDLIGKFEYDFLPPTVRSRQVHDEPTYTGYEVVMDVFDDVIAYGILLVPKEIAPGERRPVVVCQHGLEGRPQHLVTGDHRAYHDYAAKLAERGFVTFAPQNLYIFKDRFRTLQRKANPIKKTLFSIIVPQHQQITNWLCSLPYVDPERIAFYGLSYGGKTAMRVPPLVDNYCLSICSADFNEWIWKNASTRSPYSYVWTGEYEIFEFDLGNTFNYAEMASLIAPRPFMVERGHFDGVAPDETVGYEFAKVRHLYQARLGIGDRCEIEWFAGPHTINGKGSFDFLHRHLRWPYPTR